VAIIIIGISNIKIRIMKTIAMIKVKRSGLILSVILGTKAIRIAETP